MNSIDPKKMFAEGLKLFNSKRYEQAFKIFKEILALSPNNINTLVILSQLCKKKNDFHQYEFYLKKIIEIDKKNYKALNNLATFYKDSGLENKAEKLYLDSLKINNEYDKSLFNLGLLYEEKGFLEKAENLYLKALEKEKNIPSIIYKLIRINPDHFNKVDLVAIKKITDNVNSNVEERAYGYFILAIDERKKNNIENEIKYLNFGHDLIFNSNPIYINDNKYWTNYIPKKFFNKIKFINPKKNIEEKNNLSPIFVMGLPRSGTTLVESLISSNKRKIDNYGETFIIPNIIKKILENNSDELLLDISLIRSKVCKEYLKISYNREMKSTLFVDKTLENIFFIDIIKEIFPLSKIIVCERDYFDSFVAIFQQCLQGLSWAHKKSSILQYIQNFHNFVKKIKKQKNKNIHFVDLIELTENPKLISRKIFEFCDLDWDASVLKFYERDDLVIKTASNIQLRKKISKYEKNRFKKYQNPLKEYFHKINSLKI